MRRDVEIDDRKVSIVGTAHVSEESRKEVRDTIEEIEPDYIGVELDEDRFESLRDESGWKDLDIGEAIKDGKGYLLLLNLVLSIYQRRIGLEKDVSPGEELMEAVKAAEEKDIEYGLIDRNINETLRLAMSELSLWDKIKLIGSSFTGGNEIDIEDLKQDKMLDQVIKSLEDEFPALKKVFLDDRNHFMAEKILEEDFDHAVIVVGAAHVEGLVKQLEDGLKEDEAVEEDSRFSIPWIKIAKYGIPASIVFLIIYSFQLGVSKGMANLGIWVVLNSFLALIGAIIAGSKKETWAASFLISPFSSINPLLPAGLVAAYVESSVDPPNVGELEDIAQMKGFRELWGNQVGVILLTFFLVNLGSGGAAILSFIMILLNTVI